MGATTILVSERQTAPSRNKKQLFGSVDRPSLRKTEHIHGLVTMALHAASLFCDKHSPQLSRILCLVIVQKQITFAA